MVEALEERPRTAVSGGRMQAGQAPAQASTSERWQATYIVQPSIKCVVASAEGLRLCGPRRQSRPVCARRCCQCHLYDSLRARCEALYATFARHSGSLGNTKVCVRAGCKHCIMRPPLVQMRPRRPCLLGMLHHVHIGRAQVSMCDDTQVHASGLAQRAHLVTSAAAAYTHIAAQDCTCGPVSSRTQL